MRPWYALKSWLTNKFTHKCNFTFVFFYNFVHYRKEWLFQKIFASYYVWCFLVSLLTWDLRSSNRREAYVHIQLTLDISSSQGDQETVWDIEGLRYAVAVCLSCLPRDQDIKKFEIPSIRDTGANCREIHITVKFHCRVIFASAAYEYLIEER